MIMLAALVTAFFVEGNGALNANGFFLRGGLLLLVSSILWVYSFRRGTYSR